MPLRECLKVTNLIVLAKNERENNTETTLKKNYVLAVLDLCCCVGFSLVAQSRAYSLGVVCRLLNVVTSVVAEHSLAQVQ